MTQQLLELHPPLHGRGVGQLVPASFCARRHPLKGCPDLGHEGPVVQKVDG